MYRSARRPANDERGPHHDAQKAALRDGKQNIDILRNSLDGRPLRRGRVSRRHEPSRTRTHGDEQTLGIAGGPDKRRPPLEDLNRLHCLECHEDTGQSERHGHDLGVQREPHDDLGNNDGSDGPLRRQ